MGEFVDERDFAVDVVSPFDTFINFGELVQITLEVALALGFQTNVTDDAWELPYVFVAILEVAAEAGAAVALFLSQFVTE